MELLVGVDGQDGLVCLENMRHQVILVGADGRDIVECLVGQAWENLVILDGLVSLDILVGRESQDTPVTPACLVGLVFQDILVTPVYLVGRGLVVIQDGPVYLVTMDTETRRRI